MEAGKLRHRVILQSPGGTRDAVGERLTTWTNVATVWASIDPISVREAFGEMAMQGSTTHRIRIRYSSNVAAIDHSWRVLFGSRIFVLTGPPRNVEERNRELELLCVEGLRVE